MIVTRTVAAAVLTAGLAGAALAQSLFLTSGRKHLERLQAARAGALTPTGAF